MLVALTAIQCLVSMADSNGWISLNLDPNFTLLKLGSAVIETLFLCHWASHAIQ